MDDTRGRAKEMARLSVALLDNTKETLVDREWLDPADPFPPTAVSEIQEDVSQLDPAMLAMIETAVSPIPEPKRTKRTLPVVGGENEDVEDTITRSD